MMFANEADLVATFIGQVNRQQRNTPWTIYPETAGWDLLLVHREGFQLGIEAKLSLNAKVMAQVLKYSHSHWVVEGPDYRAVLVPEGKCQAHMSELAAAVGIRVLTCRRRDKGDIFLIDLPDEELSHRQWPNWCPTRRCRLPDYIPDVEAGHSAPVQLTPWKVKAIKLMIVLERRGFVTRADMKALQISPSRWTDSWHGFLAHDKSVRGYVRNDRTPDLRAQHPRNYVEIEADFAVWAKDLAPCGEVAA